MNENDTALAQVRSFNRVVTQRIGALADDYLSSGRPLGEARLLFEIGQDPHGATVKELRIRLALDSGYLSRMLRALESEGLVVARRDTGDARVRRVTLTAQGRAQWNALDQRSRDMAASVLAPLGVTQRARLVAAMAEVERFLRASAVTVEVADPYNTDAQACIATYFLELQGRFDEGFDPGQTVSATPDELVPPAGCLLIARLDGEAIGCGALKMRVADGYGEIKRMWVSPAARGLGVAQRLLDALEQRAAAAGLGLIRLDTHRNLSEARRLYARNGYEEIAAYNTNPYAHHWYEKRLGRP